MIIKKFVWGKKFVANVIVKKDWLKNRISKIFLYPQKDVQKHQQRLCFSEHSKTSDSFNRFSIVLRPNQIIIPLYIIISWQFIMYCVYRKTKCRFMSPEKSMFKKFSMSILKRSRAAWTREEISRRQWPKFALLKGQCRQIASSKRLIENNAMWINDVKKRIPKGMQLKTRNKKNMSQFKIFGLYFIFFISPRNCFWHSYEVTIHFFIFCAAGFVG